MDDQQKKATTAILDMLLGGFNEKQQNEIIAASIAEILNHRMIRNQVATKEIEIIGQANGHLSELINAQLGQDLPAQA